MQERIHFQDIKVDTKDRLEDFSLRGVDKSEYENMELFKGIAASGNQTLNFFQHSERALKQLAKAYTAGKGMYTDHNLRFSNRIGKTFKGSVVDNKVEVIFGIEKDIEISNSNDIIKIIRSTGADLSSSYYPEQVTCNVCQSDSSPYWGGYLWMCKNDHIIGSEIVKDNKTIRVTGTIQKILDVVELSLVSVGADLSSEVTEEIRQKVGDDMHFLKFIADSNGLNHDNLLLAFGMQDKKLPINIKPKIGEDNSMEIKDYAEIDVSLINDSDREDLIEIIAGAGSQIKDLHKQIATMQDTMKSSEDYEALANAHEELKGELEEAEKVVEEHSEMKSIIEDEIEYWQDKCIARKQKVRSYSDDDPRLLAYASTIREIKDINKLRNKTGEHNQTIRALNAANEVIELQKVKNSGLVDLGTK